MKDVLCLYKAVEGSKFSPEIFHNFPLNFPQNVIYLLSVFWFWPQRHLSSINVIRYVTYFNLSKNKGQKPRVNNRGKYIYIYIYMFFFWIRG